MTIYWIHTVRFIIIYMGWSVTFETFKCPLFRNTFVQARVFEVNISLDVTNTAAMNCSLVSIHLFVVTVSSWPCNGRRPWILLVLKVKFGWKRFTVFGEKVNTLIIVIHTRRELWEGITWLMREGGVGMVKHPLYDDEALHGRQLSSKRRSIDHVFYIEYRFNSCVLCISYLMYTSTGNV